MKFHGLFKKNQVSNVILGGEFVHDETTPEIENYMRGIYYSTPSPSFYNVLTLCFSLL